MPIKEIGPGQFKLWPDIASLPNPVSREKEWESVLINLERLADVTDLLLDQHRVLFFDGVHETFFFRKKKYDSAFSAFKYGGDLFYAMWYHPNPSKESYKEMFAAFGADRVESARRQFFTANPFHFFSDYGLCGGRERLISEAFFFGFESLEGVLVKDAIGINFFRESLFEFGLPPKDTASICFIHTLALLKNPNSCNPYAPGQYLWEASNSLCQNSCEVNSEEGIRKDFIFLKEIVSLVKKWGADEVHERNSDLFHYLYDSFTKRKFCDLILSVWDTTE